MVLRQGELRHVGRRELLALGVHKVRPISRRLLAALRRQAKRRA